MERCKWVNLKNKTYVEYHDNEWGVPNFDDTYLYEMFILESFQAESRQDLAQRFLETKNYINNDDLKILFNTVKEFRNEDTPFYSQPNESKKLKFSNYDHLARIKEWKE